MCDFFFFFFFAHGYPDFFIYPLPRTLYWTCELKNVISVTRLPRPTSSGGGRGYAWGEDIGSLFRSSSSNGAANLNNNKNNDIGSGGGEKEMKPRSIVVDSTQGIIFWTNMLLKPRIEKANLDGSNRVTIKLSSLGEFDLGWAR